MRRIWLVTLLSIAAAAACARAPQKAAAPTSAEPMNGLDSRGPERDRIRALESEIAADLETMGLPPPDESTDAIGPDAAEPVPMGTEVSTTCESPPTGAGCADVCTLADSICGNAQQICDLADQLAPDDWAAGRCTAARTSCARAAARCCSC